MGLMWRAAMPTLPMPTLLLVQKQCRRALCQAASTVPSSCDLAAAAQRKHFGSDLLLGLPGEAVTVMPSQPRMYLMPDGRPLRAHLADMEAAKLESSRTRRRKAGGDDKWQQWTSLTGTSALSAEEQAQVDSAMRTGRSRRRRFFNDKLLRDMAGEPDPGVPTRRLLVLGLCCLS